MTLTLVILIASAIIHAASSFVFGWTCRRIYSGIRHKTDTRVLYTSLIVGVISLVAFALCLVSLLGSLNSEEPAGEQLIGVIAIFAPGAFGLILGVVFAESF